MPGTLSLEYKGVPGISPKQLLESAPGNKISPLGKAATLALLPRCLPD
jgi:hypothetical protein